MAEKKTSKRSLLRISSMVPEEGFEPPTPGSEDQCSNPLSYSGII
jgi:hypothetical protein